MNPGEHTVVRFRGGANVPGRYGRVNATLPFGCLSFDESALRLQMRPRLFGARDLVVSASDVKEILPVRGPLFFTPGIGFKLSALRRTQALLHTLVDVREIHPPTQARLADPEILRDLRDRLLPATSQLNSPTPELRRLGSRHTGLLSETIFASEQVSGLAGQAPKLLIALRKYRAAP